MAKHNQSLEELCGYGPCSEAAAEIDDLKRQLADHIQRQQVLEDLLAVAREREKRLREAVRRLLLWPELHEQQNPGWNGNRFDDMQLGKKALNESEAANDP